MTPEEAWHRLRTGTPVEQRAVLGTLAENADARVTPAVAPLLHADDPELVSLAENTLWRVWSRSGDPAVDALFAEGLRAIEAQDWLGAVAAFNRVIDRIKARGWHLVLHVDAPDIIPLSEMMRKLPLPFVVDHMGRVPSAAGVDQPPLRALIELSRLEKCWIKVCGSERISMPPYVAAVPIAHALVETAPDRVLWGTDFPHPNATHEADEADLVDLVPQFAPDALAQKSLLVDNPARLYGFGS